MYISIFLIPDIQFRSFKTERISSKENDEKLISRIKELLLYPKGGDFKNNDIFSDAESNKWNGKFLLYFILMLYYV